MTPAEQLLRDAAKLLSKRGVWAQNEYVNPCAGRHCLYTVINGTPAYEVLLSVTGTGVIDFNDFHCKTKRDAVAALEIAADLAS